MGGNEALKNRRRGCGYENIIIQKPRRHTTETIPKTVPPLGYERTSEENRRKS